MANFPNQIPIKVAQDAIMQAVAELKSLIFLAGLQNVTIATDKPSQFTDQVLSYTPDAKISTSAQLGSGIPVYSDLTIEGCAYTDTVTGDKVTVGTPGKPYMKFQTCIITMTKVAVLKETEIQGGTEVTEYIGSKNALITIKGVITSKNGVHPYTNTALLQEWLDAPVSKGISCRWLNNLNIFNVIVKGYDLPQMEGSYSQQFFTINCKADIAVALKVYAPIQ